MYKRKRSSVRRRRTRPGRRRTKKSTQVVTKQYLKKQLDKAIESKKTCSIVGLTKLDLEAGTGYFRHRVGSFLTPGVTDNGRIGNTIHLTGVRVNYVFTATSATAATYPYVLNIMILKMKSQFAVPEDTFYKAFNMGAEEPYVPLTLSAIQDGRRIYNTESYNILAHKKVTLRPNLNTTSIATSTGKLALRLPRTEMKFFSNSTLINTATQIVPGIYIFMFVYTGSGTGYPEGDGQDFQIRACMSEYYKD